MLFLVLQNAAKHWSFLSGALLHLLLLCFYPWVWYILWYILSCVSSNRLTSHLACLLSINKYLSLHPHNTNITLILKKTFSLNVSGAARGVVNIYVMTWNVWCRMVAVHPRQMTRRRPSISFTSGWRRQASTDLYQVCSCMFSQTGSLILTGRPAVHQSIKRCKRELCLTSKGKTIWDQK